MNTTRFEHFSSGMVYCTGVGHCAITPLLNTYATGAAGSKALRPIHTKQPKQPSTWKAMTTTNAKVQSAPSFWQKWWNAFVKWFNGDRPCSCATEEKSTSKVEESKITEKEAKAY